MRTITMRSASLMTEMRPGETREQAEDRLIEALESVGVRLLGWKNSDVYVEEWEDDETD